jgi:hypothetical protein
MNPDSRKDLECQKRNRVAAAEKRSGYREGGFMFQGRAVSVSVSFCPIEQWWIEIPGGEKMELTDDIWANCATLKL